MTATGTPKTAVTGYLPSNTSEPVSAVGLFRCQRAGAGNRTERLLAAHLLDDLVVVPRIFGFLRRLHLHDVHGMHHDAVRPDIAALGEHVVDLGPLELCHDLVGIGGSDSLDGLEIGQRSGV